MKYDELAKDDVISKTLKALEERNFHGIVVESRDEALDKVKELIPKGSSVMNGGSRTLEEIGYIKYLISGDHGWINIHEDILQETDSNKQGDLRRQSVLSDFYIGSAHALSETGEIVIGSNTGSQLPHLAFTSPNIILIVGTQKIVPTLNDAIKRLEDYVTPLEDVRLMEVMKSHTHLSKTLILHYENPFMKRNFQVILVKEKLGF